MEIKCSCSSCCCCCCCCCYNFSAIFRHGDVYVNHFGNGFWEILRKTIETKMRSVLLFRNPGTKPGSLERGGERVTPLDFLGFKVLLLD